ncbi:MAG: hypothetical protein K2H63_07845 [Paramuribaculum sp.]|nr:hypothetical protein [Paramuribaculum sp.]
MTITLSIPAITADIYARSALHHIDPATTPTLLTTDSAEALSQLIHDEIDSLALSLDATATHTGSTVQLTLRLAPAAPVAAVEAALQRVVALRILAEAVFTLEPPYAESLLDAAHSTLSLMGRFVSAIRTNLPRITPHPFALIPLFSLLLC